jgi:hypothetical protein
VLDLYLARVHALVPVLALAPARSAAAGMRFNCVVCPVAF